MTPLGRTGFVKEGPLAGWYISAAEMERPKGFLVSRARNAEMDQTLVMDGIFPTRDAMEAFFQAQAPVVEWR
ncbi:MAG: hypothetical protein LWX11_02975 [Firmicutes bacterium]|nr:hypothetical protein [Bacillota bacterium]